MSDRRIDVDWAQVDAAARRGGRPTPDDVTVMSDGRRIDSAEKVRALVDEFLELQPAADSVSTER